MNNTVTLVPSDQIIVAYSDGEITTRDISRALFYANSRLLAMRLYIDKSFPPPCLIMQKFFTHSCNGKWRCSATIPKPLHNVIAILVEHKLMNQQPDVNEVLMEIKALPLSVNSATSDEYDIACMPNYFNAWVLDMLPKSSVQDVMELVEGHFLELPNHVETDLLLYMLTLGLVH
ncbi:uncharacterized protein EDB93DRAFT_1103559 [Suillus bovinus]|uniref:uncharacterized protein n=1 Tax=Suillus bovinus TaxID=48563 RepID=UPI001B878A38|nr:uncharacterized protein EDB93DRAFT_1103559 [Suillus bovinus]KAG2150344.1 hypothetical protein EDB93DRAFT_1103559 [Suillus bovinus]